MATFDAFWRLDTRNFHSINEALMTLIPKSAAAKSIKDYRHIALIHVLGKLFSKVLAARLAPFLDKKSSIKAREPSSKVD
jgi:hypothetical protein